MPTDLDAQHVSPDPIGDASDLPQIACGVGEATSFFKKQGSKAASIPQGQPVSPDPSGVWYADQASASSTPAMSTVDSSDSLCDDASDSEGPGPMASPMPPDSPIPPPQRVPLAHGWAHGDGGPRGIKLATHPVASRLGVTREWLTRPLPRRKEAQGGGVEHSQSPMSPADRRYQRYNVF